MKDAMTEIAGPRQPSPGGWIVLGLLLDAPRSGYELAGLAQRSVGQFWPVTKAHVYGELPRLERLGYVTGQDVAQKGVPDKRVYSATPQGREAFCRWLAGTDLGEPLLRHPLLVQVFFSTHLPIGRMQEVVSRYRERVKTAYAHYSAILDGAAGLHQTQTKANTDAPSMRRLAVRYALVRLKAELLWLDEVEQAITLEE